MSHTRSKKEEHGRNLVQDMIDRLKAGTSPLQQLWVPGQHAFRMPYNAVSGRSYSLANGLRLWAQQEALGYTDSRWLTVPQGNGLGARVRKGEKSTGILMRFTRKAEAEHTKPEHEAEDETSRPYFSMMPVFNAQQFDGLAPQPATPVPGEFERHARCEALIEDVRASGVLIEHDGGNQAYYHPSTDSIHLPQRGQFRDSSSYYGVVLHECGHATGHPSRLNRDLSGKFGSASYAREELRAELASLMAGDRLQIGFQLGQHDAYVGHWIKLLENDYRELFSACADAERICEHLKIEKYEHLPTPKLERAVEQTVESQGEGQGRHRRQHKAEQSMGLSL